MTVTGDYCYVLICIFPFKTYSILVRIVASFPVGRRAFSFTFLKFSPVLSNNKIALVQFPDLIVVNSTKNYSLNNCVKKVSRTTPWQDRSQNETRATTSLILLLLIRYFFLDSTRSPNVSENYYLKSRIIQSAEQHALVWWSPHNQFKIIKRKSKSSTRARKSVFV